MEKDTAEVILPVTGIELVKIWWFERGIGQYHIDGESGSAGFYGKYNLEDFGNILHSKIEAAKVDKKIEHLLGTIDAKTGILMGTNKETYKLKEKEMHDFSSGIFLSQSENEVTQVDIYIEGLVDVPFGSDGEATLSIRPQVQLAMDIWDRTAKIITPGSLYFNKEMDVSMAMAYMNQLFEAEKKIFKTIRRQIPENFNLGNVVHWVNIPGVKISDPYFLTALNDISVRESEEGTAYIYNGQNLKTINPYLLGQLNLLNEYINCNPILRRQRRHPKVPEIRTALAYSPLKQ